jgi:hypothetical protein
MDETASKTVHKLGRQQHRGMKQKTFPVFHM